MNDEFYTIITEGEYKGKRLYYEDKCGGDQILSVELYYLFQNSFKQGYNVFLLNCIPNHNIKIPIKDVEFLKTDIKSSNRYLYNQHIFSEEILKIKKYQYYDLKQIYDFSINSKMIGSFFMYPYWNNDFYCFNIFLIVKNDFKFEDFFKIEFNLIKINSVVKYHESTLDINFLKKIYDLINLPFKDYTIKFEDLEKTRPYDENKLIEKIELDKWFQYYIDNNRNENFDNVNYEIKEKILQENFYKKKAELWDIELTKKLNFEKLCNQFYFFNEDVLSDQNFYTNFLQLTKSSVVLPDENDGFKIDYEYFQPYSLSDMFCWDEYRLFSRFVSVYQ